MTDRQFLEWIHARLEFTHGENPNVDYMLRLKRIIVALEKDEAVDESSNGLIAAMLGVIAAHVR